MIIFTNLNIVNRKAFERTKDEHLTKSEGRGIGEGQGSRADEERGLRIKTPSQVFRKPIQLSSALSF